jgi:hypothetical protein
MEMPKLKDLISGKVSLEDIEHLLEIAEHEREQALGKIDFLNLAAEIIKLRKKNNEVL